MIPRTQPGVPAHRWRFRDMSLLNHPWEPHLADFSRESEVPPCFEGRALSAIPTIILLPFRVNSVYLTVRPNSPKILHNEIYNILISKMHSPSIRVSFWSTTPKEI